MAAQDDLLQGMQQLLMNMQENQAELYRRLQFAEARRDQPDRPLSVNMKLLDKVGDFDGKRGSWDDWSFSFKAVMSSEGQEALNWASIQED